MLSAPRSRWHEVCDALRGYSPRAVIFVARENGLHHHRDLHATSVASANGTAPHPITHLAPCGLVEYSSYDNAEQLTFKVLSVTTDYWLAENYWTPD